MAVRPRMVILFKEDEKLGELPYSQFAGDRYFPRGGEVVPFNGKAYVVAGLRPVYRQVPGELCVDVKEAS